MLDVLPLPTAVHGIPDLVGSSVKGQLESEGTGEDGGQVYRVSADQALVDSGSDSTGHCEFR